MSLLLDIDPKVLAAKIGQCTGAALLESGPGFGNSGRWSILTAWPSQIFEAWGDSWSSRGDGEIDRSGTEDTLDALANFLAENGLADSRGQPEVDQPPFMGGAIGTIGYDVGTQIETLPRKAKRDTRWPDICLQVYDWAICVDHQRDEVRLWTPESDLSSGTIIDRVLRVLDGTKSLGHSRLLEPLKSNFEPDDYRAAVSRALEYIAAGDIFQVNLSQRFAAHGEFDPLDLYLRLKNESPAPFAAFLRHNQSAVISASPEWFYQTRGSKISTRPIKGTRRRGLSPQEDDQLIHDLMNSPKDRAELTMIVDLERNDLGRICEYGSVKVTESMVLETYAQVHHLVATVEGTLRANVGPVDVLRAMFPGGSVTGAPKIRAMEIIDELEPTQRGIYTGAIGYFSRGGTSAFNIAIRTMLVETNLVSYQVGGGIVADSDPDSEYLETLHKGRGLRKVLESP